MDLYFAPLEGIGGFLYRNAQAEFFTRADKYFSPFISPMKDRGIRPREKRDVCPENNAGIRLVPQILTNDAEAFLQTAKELWEMGYAEVNLNLGCPSKTVVSKKRGAGFLAFPEKLDRFLEEIFEKCAGMSAGGEICRKDGHAQNHMRISVKTRLGMTDPEEFEPILEIFNRYPLEELIVHPRVQMDYYKNTPRMEMFDYAVEHCKCPLVYNGDICSVGDYERLMARMKKYVDCCSAAGSEHFAVKSEQQKKACVSMTDGRLRIFGVGKTECEYFPVADDGKSPALSEEQENLVSAVMIGRGILANPALFGEIRGEAPLEKDRLRAFHDRLLADYQTAMPGEHPVLCKMKELWVYMAPMFTNYEKYAKQIRKAKRICEYRAAVRELFAEQELV